MNKYTIEELEIAFHNYFKAKQHFLLIAKRYCEQQKVDEGQNMTFIEPADDNER